MKPRNARVVVVHAQRELSLEWICQWSNLNFKHTLKFNWLIVKVILKCDNDNACCFVLLSCF